jgi:hypothetical protein
MNFILSVIDFFSATRSIRRSGLLILIFLFAASVNTFATHLRAGNILLKRDSKCSLGFEITILVYTRDTQKDSDVLFGGDGVVIDFGDGNVEEVPIGKNHLIDPDREIAWASYTTYHTYGGAGRYTISYREPNRNEGVLNMYDSRDTEFYLETTVDVTYCNTPITLTVPPIDRGCKGKTWFHNAGAYDPDGVDSLSYQLVIPFQDRGLPVAEYKDPSDKSFYPTNYATGNEAGNKPPTFKIDAHDGTITWDAPGAVGEYNIAFVIIEYTKVNGHWREVTRIRRDMQIIIEDCKDKRPDLDVPKDICIQAGDSLKKVIKAYDLDSIPNKVKLQGFSEIFKHHVGDPPVTPARATLSLNGDSTYTSHPTFQPSPLYVDFNWQPSCRHVQAQPYQVVFKVTEETQSQLATFKTWSIKVVGPKPNWKAITLASPRKVVLEWKNYACADIAQTMQIWRRVDSVSFTPDTCQTGMPALGYELIATVPMRDVHQNPITSYTDTNNGKGLASGATYCYRLVAEYPRGGESYVSTDTCIGPIMTHAPIITNVTVDSTAEATGEITVKWHKPLLPPSFSSAYTYDLYRGIGFTGASTKIATGLTDTTTIVPFMNGGLDTKEDVYNYMVVAVDGSAKDSSATASSVRLETTSRIKKIALQWSAEVPWSNVSQDYPKHRIYRGPTPSFSQMTLIDSVNVLNNGFVYLDSGQYQHQGLKDGTDYCYIVETLGTYGDKNIKAPLRNFSQAVCTQTGDSIPPCKMEPPLRSTLDYIDCDDYFLKFGCHVDAARNILTWNAPEDEDCRNDVFEYEIFWAPDLNGIYLKIGVTRDTFYIHSLKDASFAGCYKIAAVDRSGNVGDLSDPLCIDNCPHYELPNVFSPDGDHCNETFNAFNDVNDDFKPNEQGYVKCPPVGDITQRCPRFVESVIFKVYNRWGKEVYNFVGGSGNGNTNSEKNTIYINWDGRDNNGNELVNGVYYYMAEVTFKVVNPSQNTKIIKGWVHLIR